jgi:hypothetical protein
MFKWSIGKDNTEFGKRETEGKKLASVPPPVMELWENLQFDPNR